MCGVGLVCVKPTAKEESTGGDGAGDVPADVTSWPDAVGKSGEEAKVLILASNAKLRVEIIPKDAFVTADWWGDRVRVRVDDASIVVETPVIG